MITAFDSKQWSANCQEYISYIYMWINAVVVQKNILRLCLHCDFVFIQADNLLWIRYYYVINYDYDGDKTQSLAIAILRLCLLCLYYVYLTSNPVDVWCRQHFWHLRSILITLFPNSRHVWWSFCQKGRLISISRPSKGTIDIGFFCAHFSSKHHNGIHFPIHVERLGLIRFYPQASAKSTEYLSCARHG